VIDPKDISGGIDDWDAADTFRVQECCDVSSIADHGG
jgi:hypothetical protein